MADPYAHQYPAPAAGHQPQYPPSPFGPQQHQQAYDQTYFASQTPMQHQQPMLADQPVPLQNRTHDPYEHVNNKPNGYSDPQAVSLSDYAQAEREEQVYKNNNHYYQDAGYGGGAGGGYPDYDYNNQYGAHNQQHGAYGVYHDDPSDIPMVQQNYSKQNTSRPRPAGPTLAPDDEADAYHPKTYQRHEDGGGCNCCCYNPECTCCGCYCMILSLAFLAAGIALIVAASVIQDKCDNQCGNIPDQLDSTVSACGTVCEKVVHDGLFYGGIGVTALAGIAVLWRLIMCMCAAGSRH
ncbi:hypothetical protein BDB00DRAFT_842559 [Zychaea mexicana]|uniref:uncharacterized protein n=1 Tax=Zychaea mexicana TaxID=64656 RepID=UPI0022FDB725|nr:uncharacterized protein BDB00DRAFT_842559 [Zychaea mexicana]KAI9489574.1 hypothetical protein BDB00DRAFT_842559 [Zychaea mexicana]